MRTVDPSSWWSAQHKPAQRFGRAGRPGAAAGAGLEPRLRASLGDAAREFLRHSSVQGIRHVADPDATTTSRVCYALLLVCLVAGGTWAMSAVVLELSQQAPLQVRAQAPAAAAAAFPAVALCSNCLIRKRALAAYTDHLMSKVKNSTYSRWEINANLMKFGALFTVSLQPQDLQFMRFLYSIDPNFNVTDLMYKLSPRCSDWLQRCAWRGHNVECARLFARRVTPLGFCCVFNARYHPVDVHQPPKVLDVAGRNYGLTVMAKEDLEDVAFSRRPAVGFDVLIFDGMEYPLLETGAAQLVPVGREEAAFFLLSTHTQYPSAALHRYSEHWVRSCPQLRCRIKQPGSARSARRSYSWCLTECRRRITAALCGCLPLALLPNASELVCTPEHLQCLNKHREKLLYYYPGAGVRPQGLEEEFQDSQDCTHCPRDCARARHEAAPYRVPILYPDKLLRSLFSTGGVSVQNVTLLRFYYDSIAHGVSTADVNVQLFQMLVMVGCQARVLLGLSLVSVAELVFFLALRWPRHLLRRSPALVARWRRLLQLLRGGAD